MITRDNWWARLISMTFHPLILPTLAIFILLSIPSYISFSTPMQARRLIIGLMFANTCIAPLLIIFLMKKTGLISDILLDNRADRIYPTLISIFFYLFTYYLFKQANLPSLLHFFILASAFLVLIGFAVTFYWKISFHMISMGGFTGFLIVMSLALGFALHLLIVISILISGLLGSARIKLNAHSPSQVYVGFLIGILTMLIFFLIMRG